MLARLRQFLLQPLGQLFLPPHCTTVYSPVILLLAWPAIWLASMLLPPTSCRQVMLARRSVCSPRPANARGDYRT